MSRYLVTGGLGVVGSLFAKGLLADGHDVIVVDDGKEARHQLNRPSCEVVPRRLAMEPGTVAQLAGLIRTVDFVIHTAASTGIPYSGKEPLDDWDRNANGTLCLLEALRLSPKPTVALSSVKPYAADQMPLTNETILSPDEPYAASKAAQSMMCQAWARSYGLPVVTFRCSNLYGPGACHGPRHGWATWFAIQAALGMTLELQGTGDQARDMLFHTDLLRAVLAGLDNAERLSGEIFTIGGGPKQVISVNEAAEFLRTLEPELKTKSGPGRRFEDELVFVDNFQVTQALNWHPTVNPHEGLTAIYEWAKANREALRGVYAEYV